MPRANNNLTERLEQSDCPLYYAVLLRCDAYCGLGDRLIMPLPTAKFANEFVSWDTHVDEARTCNFTKIQAAAALLCVCLTAANRNGQRQFRDAAIEDGTHHMCWVKKFFATEGKKYIKVMYEESSFSKHYGQQIESDKDMATKVTEWNNLYSMREAERRQCIFCFICKETGNVYKPATYNRPQINRSNLNIGVGSMEAWNNLAVTFFGHDNNRLWWTHGGAFYATEQHAKLQGKDRLLDLTANYAYQWWLSFMDGYMNPIIEAQSKTCAHMCDGPTYNRFEVHDAAARERNMIHAARLGARD